MGRVILAGLLGGLALFAWESVVASLRDNGSNLAYISFQPRRQPEQHKLACDRNPSVPTGGHHEHDAQSLLTQLGANIAAMIIAGILLAQAGGFPGFGKRVVPPVDPICRACWRGCASTGTFNAHT